MEQLRDALENLGQNRKSIWYLKLRKNPLSTFPSFLLENLNIGHLVAHHCNITSIDDLAFAGLSHFMESLDLSQNQLTEVSYSIIRELVVLIYSLIIGSKQSIKTIDIINFTKS